MAKKPNYKKMKKQQKKKVARTNKKLLTIVISIVAVVLFGVGGLWFYAEYRGAERNITAGDNLFAAGKFSEARKQYGRAVSKEPANLKYVQKLQDAVLAITPVTPTEARTTYDDYVRTLVHEARYNPQDIDAHLRVAEEMYNAAFLTGSDNYWLKLRVVAKTGLDRVSLSNPRRHELNLYRGLATLRIDDATMTDTYDEVGNVRFPGESDFELVLENDPGNAMAWATLAHGRMAVYYRLNDEGKTKQARRNRVFADETMEQALEIAGGSFEVSASLLRERLLQRTALLQQRVANPNSVTETQIDEATQKIVEVRAMIEKSYDPALHFARAGEITSLVVSTDEDGKEVAIGILQKTIDKHPNDFGSRYILSGLLVQIDKREEARVLSDSILEAENQTAGLHAIELYSLRPIAAQSLIRMAVENAVNSEDDTDQEAAIKEADQYREVLSDLVSGDEMNQYLLYADGIIALAKEQYALAAKKLELTISRNPDVDASVYRQSAFALSKTDAKGLAVERLQRAIELEPSNLSYYIAKARLEVQLSDHQAASTTLSALPTGVRSRDDVQEVLNIIAMQQSGADQTSFSDPALRYISLSEQLAKEKKYDEAVTALTEAIDLAPTQDWRLFLAMSNVFGRMDDREQAVEWLQKAIDSAPNPTALLPRLHILQSDNRVDALISLVESQDDTEANKAEELAVALYELSMNSLGDSNRWVQIGNTQEAETAKELSDQAMEASKQYQELAESLGADMTRIVALRFTQEVADGNFVVAEQYLEELSLSSTKQLEVDSARISLLLAKAIDAKSRGELAVFNSLTSSANSIAQKMVSESSISDFAWRTLGRVLVEIGEMKEAKNAYAEAYRISPKNKENIRRYISVLITQSDEQQRMLRVLRIAREQYPNDRQLQTAWLEAEGKIGERWKVLVYRMNGLVLNPEDRTNALELAFSLVNLTPNRGLLRDLEGNELYSTRVWEQMPTALKQSALNDARREWDKTVQDILDKADEQVDPSIRIAMLHASIHRDLGQLEQSSEIWDRFITNAKGTDQYTKAVIAAADFLQRSNRIQQAIQFLENAREAQSELLEIDGVLGSLYFILGEFKLATEYMEQPVRVTKNQMMHSRYIEALAMSGQFDKAMRELGEYTTTNSEYAEQMLRSLISRVKSEQMLAQGDIEGGKIALQEYRNTLRAAIGADSRNPIPYIRLCRSLLNEYRLTQDKQLLQEALQVAEEASATEQQSEQFIIVRADVLQADGQLPRSIDHLMRYLSENPDSSNVRTRLIEAYLDSDNVDRALAAAKAGVAVDPSDPLWHQRLGDLYIRANDDRVEGVKAYLEAIQRNPSLLLLMKIDEMTRTNQELPNQELLEMARGPLSKLHPIAGTIEAKALKNLGRNRDALIAMEKSWRIFNQAVTNNWISPQSTASWFLNLQTLFEEDPAAGETFVRALVNGPMTQHQLAGLAGYYQLVGGEYVDKALDIIDNALAMENSDPDARMRLLMMRGGFLVEAGRYAESAETFSLLAEESNSPLVQNNLAYVVGVFQDKPEEGLRIAKEAAKQSPRNASIIDTVSSLYQRLGEHQKAADSLDFLLQIDPSNSKAMAKLSLLYSENLGDPARGIVFAERGRIQNPRSPEVLDALGWGYYRMGKIEQAEETINRSIRNGDTMEAYLHLAQIVTENMEFDEALGHLRMAQELAEDPYSLKRIQTHKDDIRKKKAEALK